MTVPRIIFILMTKSRGATGLKQITFGKKTRRNQKSEERVEWRRGARVRGYAMGKERGEEMKWHGRQRGQEKEKSRK